MYHIDLLEAADLPVLMTIQQACYQPELNESAAIMAARLASNPGWCWALRHHEQLAAYLLSRPARSGQVTPLDGEFSAEEAPDCLYLHDLAVSPAYAGQGLGRMLVAHATAVARHHGWLRLALVCVQTALPFWQQLGFQHAALDTESSRKLASYPGTARYLTRG